MLRIIRQIRRKLLENKKGRQCFLYAIGEIVLIMVGILLALQVNNWNEARKDQKVEAAYLKAIKTECEGNQKRLSRAIKRNKKCIENAEKLIAVLSQPVEEISAKEVSFLFNETLKYNIQFHPNTGVLHDIINSGNFNKISNLELRNLIAGWETDYERLKAQEEMVETIRVQTIDLLKQNSHFDGIYHPENENLVGLELNIKNDNANFNVIENPAFKNNLLFFVVISSALGNNYYERFEQHLEESVEKIESETKQ